MKFPFSRFTVHGNSMFPTLNEGQDVLCFNWAYVFSKRKVGDIIVITIKGKELVKRIHKINDRLIYVQGDNKSESTDSRSFGPIKKSEILGKVIWY